MKHENRLLSIAVAGILLSGVAVPASAVFDVYPSPQTNPLTVAAGATSAAQPFTERVGTGTGPVMGTDGMYIRLVMLGGGCAPSASPDPTVTLQAGAGGQVALNGFFQGVFDGAMTEVADARIQAEADDVFRIDFLMLVPGSAWTLRITNNDMGAARDFTWVVGQDEPETRQPWIDVDDTLDFDTVLGGLTLTGQASDPVLVEVRNMGTGDLTVSDSIGVIGTSDFEITAVPVPIPPNGCDNLGLRFNGPATAGQSNAAYTVGNNDTTAVTGDPTAAHNEEIGLSASAGKLEVMLMVDASGSMAYKPDGDPVVPSPGEARWGRLKSAAKQFLDLLGTMGAGQGRFAVGMFPDITSIDPPCPVAVPTAADFAAAQDITLAATDAAKNALDDHTPVQRCAGTPIGFGIGRAIGTLASGFGYFEGPGAMVDFNERFLVLMSDGANNSGPPDPPDFYGTGTTSFQGKNVKALTIAYGDPGVTSFHVDHALLSTIATESLGQMFDAGVDDAGLDLKKDFRGAITASLALDPTTDPGGVLAAGSEIRRPVTVTPYDSKVAFVVNWGTVARDRLAVTLLTPQCELITPESATADPDIFYSDHPTYKMFVFEDDFLRNAGDPTNPRYGEWTLVISRAPVIGATAVAGEPYDYEVLTKSRLRLSLSTGKSAHYAGDPIDLTARLSLDGLGIRDASVTVEVTAPGQAAANWLAFNPATRQELSEARQGLDPQDTTSLGVKAAALQAKGLRFSGLEGATKLPMTDESGRGVYTARVAETSVPGTYELYVVATGTTDDGVAFRREKRLDVRVGVRPVPEFTLVDVQYRLVVEEGETFQVADVRFWPRDRFGNVVLTDPDTDTGIAVTAANGQIVQPLDDPLVDGSYTTSIRYRPGQNPGISIQVGGEDLLPSVGVAPVGKLTYADRVVDFDLGAEAEPGANQHRDPEAALGDVTAKDPDEFLSLGGHGTLVVGVHGRTLVAQGEDDVTVFVRGDTELRSYVVEAQDWCRTGRWVELGRSDGVTQSFSLGAAGLDRASAIRIRDTSGRTRDGDLEPLSTPGVSVRGVGFRKTAKKCFLKRFFHCLFGKKG